MRIFFTRFIPLPDPKVEAELLFVVVVETFKTNLEFYFWINEFKKTAVESNVLQKTKNDEGQYSEFKKTGKEIIEPQQVKQNEHLDSKFKQIEITELTKGNHSESNYSKLKQTNTDSIVFKIGNTNKNDSNSPNFISQNTNKAPNIANPEYNSFLFETRNKKGRDSEGINKEDETQDNMKQKTKKQEET